MESIDLSVIVACYNVADFLPQCLASIQGTTFPKEHLEVIMVDDGSDDETSAIIDEYDQKYSYFHAYHKENGGISTTRNFGMDKANGKYIAFVDGDDIVPKSAYTDLMYSAEINQADVVAGFVTRFDSLRHDVPSYLHSFAIKDNRTHLSLKKAPELLYDTTVWNKVYSRQFLNDHQLRFTEDIIYEDLPFTLEVHLASRNTVTIKDVVYQWRWRETSDSITQSRNAIANYQNRLNALNRCSQLLINSGYDIDSTVYKTLEKKVVTLDLAIFLDEIGNAEEDYIYRFQELTYLFLRDWNLWDTDLIKAVPLKQQIQFYAIKNGDFELLKKYTYVKNIGLFKRYFWTGHYKYYFPTMKKAPVLKALSYSDNMFPNDQALNRINVDEEHHKIYGNGMFRILRLPLTKKIGDNSNYRERVSAKLVNVENHKEMKIKFGRKVTPFYKRFFKPKGLWTNARYQFEFDYLAALRKMGRGIWMIQMNDTVDGRFKAVRYMGNFERNLNDSLKHLHSQKSQIVTEFNTNGELTFNVLPLSMIGSQEANWVANPQLRRQNLSFDANIIDFENVVPVLTNGQINLKGHLSDQNQINFALDQVGLKALLDQKLHLKLIHQPTNKSVDYIYDSTIKMQTFGVNPSQSIEILHQVDGGIDVLARFNPIQINSISLKQNVLLLSGKINFQLDQFDVQLDAIQIEMLNKSKSRRYLLNSTENKIRLNGQQINFQIPLTNPAKTQLLVLAGNYTLIAYLPINGTVHQLPLMMSSKNSIDKRSLPFADKDVINYRFFSNKDARLHIAITQPFYGFADNKRSRRALNYSLWYPLMRLLPLQPVIVFDSYWASQFSSNEKAIYEYLQTHYPKFKLVWFFTNRQIPITGNGIRVKKGTFKYWYYLAVAKYLFQNTNFPDEYIKRPHQVEIETLHGTFLKHMGFNEPHFRNASRKIQNNFAERIRRWDYLVVPSNYMAKTASSAFDYHQKIIRSGFPRNDELYTKNRPQTIHAIKKRLQIPDDKKVVLYAPTYRNDGGFDFRLDLKQLKEKLSDQYVVLVRLHYFVAHSNHFYDYPGFVYDVSDYDDINDLYLISDVLVTDYSSVMFDYAHLNRPMIFFAYDHDWYLDDHNRGVYLNYDRQMPGPIVKTNQALIDALVHLNTIEEQYHDRLQSFHDQFAEYGNDGQAAKQVVETILQTPDSELDQETASGVIFDKFWHIFKIKNLQSKLLKYLGNHLPTRDIIIFDSFFGTQYSDNPKAIYEYLRDHNSKYRLYWDASDEMIPFFKQHHIPYIKRFGYHGIFKQAQAKYLITNVRRPFRWKVPKGMTVLQTWHGTPLKKIGTDVSLVTMPGNNAINYHHEVYRDAKRWNYLIAPNPYSNQIMQRAFQMDANEMMLTGYPRNDILINADQQYIDNIKHRLNINSDKKVLLYAPTWRDDEYIKSDQFTAQLHLDLKRLQSHFNDQVVVLVRTHYLIANQLDLSDDDGAINVSQYPDIADLYLISDVLITDYSSVMFDYSVLKRPMIFFDYDLDQYANNIRGFYFDFTTQAPGPIVKTNDQVITALEEIFKGWQPDDKYLQFMHQYDQWMDGKATERVVAQLLNHDNVYPDQQFDYLKKWHLDSKVKVRDGAILWNINKDFTQSNSDAFLKNYNEKEEWFDVVSGMQLKSRSFDQPLGMRFVLLKKNNWSGWVSLDDLN